MIILVLTIAITLCSQNKTVLALSVVVRYYCASYCSAVLWAHVLD